MSKKLIALIVALPVLGFVLGVIGGNSSVRDAVGGTFYDVQRFIGDVYQGSTEVLMMRDGEFVGPIDTQNTVTIGARLREYEKCTTATWNPPALVNSTFASSIASTSIVWTGSFIPDITNDSCSFERLSTATSSVSLIYGCNVSANDSTTASSTISLLSGDNINFGTGTATICYVDNDD